MIGKILIAAAAAAVVGAVGVAIGTKAYKKANTPTRSYTTITHVSYAPKKHKKKHKSSASRQPIQTPSSSKYDKKVDFFDSYRALDNYLGDMVGESHGGVALFAVGLKNRGIKTNNGQDCAQSNKLHKCREYRNMIGHDKSKWSSIRDPEPWMEPFLRQTLSWAARNYSTTIQLVSSGKQHMKSKNKIKAQQHQKQSQNRYQRRNCPSRVPSYQDYYAYLRS